MAVRKAASLAFLPVILHSLFVSNYFQIVNIFSLTFATQSTIATMLPFSGTCAGNVDEFSPIPKTSRNVLIESPSSSSSSIHLRRDGLQETPRSVSTVKSVTKMEDAIHQFESSFREFDFTKRGVKLKIEMSSFSLPRLRPPPIAPRRDRRTDRETGIRRAFKYVRNIQLISRRNVSGRPGWIQERHLKT